MGRLINQTLQELLDADSCETQSTLELRLLDGTVRRYATTDDVLGALGEVYGSDLRKTGEIIQSAFGSVDRTNSIVQNVDKIIGLEILSGVIDRATAIVGRLYRSESDPSIQEWVELFRGEAKPTEVEPISASIEIVDDLVAAGYCVAAFTLEPACPLVYGSFECGADPALPPCSHNLETCRILHRFAGMETKIETVSSVPGDSGGGGIGGDGGGGYRECFTSGTRVLSATWWRRILFAFQMAIFGRVFVFENLLSKNIESVKSGESIYAPDASGVLCARRVVDTFENETSQYLNVWFEGKETPTGVTAAHPYRTLSGEFAPIGEIGVALGEVFSHTGGKRITRKVTKIENVQPDAPMKIYNLQIEDLATYIANGDEVHNRSQDPDLFPIYQY